MVLVLLAHAQCDQLSTQTQNHNNNNICRTHTSYPTNTHHNTWTQLRHNEYNILGLFGWDENNCNKTELVHCLYGWRQVAVRCFDFVDVVVVVVESSSSVHLSEITRRHELIRMNGPKKVGAMRETMQMPATHNHRIGEIDRQRGGWRWNFICSCCDDEFSVFACHTLYCHCVSVYKRKTKYSDTDGSRAHRLLSRCDGIAIFSFPKRNSSRDVNDVSNKHEKQFFLYFHNFSPIFSASNCSLWTCTEWTNFHRKYSAFNEILSFYPKSSSSMLLQFSFSFEWFSFSFRATCVPPMRIRSRLNTD